MTGPFRVEILEARHDRKAFHCGVEALDRYFREQVTQDVRRRATACYVAVEAATARVAGYYTLAAGGVALYQGRRLGGALLCDAQRRAARSEVAVFGLGVDAKDELAEAFYRHHGFAEFGSLPRQLILPL
jgi:hypothetical protein